MTFLDKLRKKINDEFEPEKILLIDNSKLHTKHKFFDSNKFHLMVGEIYLNVNYCVL